jgi:hypothetical protein
MIDRDAAIKIEQALKVGEVYLKSELSIENKDNRIELGLFYGSSMDIDAGVFKALEELSFNSV